MSDPYSELLKQWKQSPGPPSPDPYADLIKQWQGDRGLLPPSPPIAMPRAPLSAPQGRPPLPQPIPQVSMRAATPAEIRGRPTREQVIASRYLSPQAMSQVGISPTGMPLPRPPGTAERIIGGLQEGYLRGVTAPFPIPERQAFAPTRPEQIARTTGEFAGFATGPVGRLIFRAPMIVRGPLGQVFRNFQAGAAYNILDTIVSHHQDLMKMPPGEAARTLANSAGIGGAGFAAVGVGFETLARSLQLAGPAGLSAVRAIRDALHPNAGSVPVSVGGKGVPPEPVRPRRRPSAQAVGILPPGADVLQQSIQRIQREANDLYGAVHRQVQPARAPGVVGRPFTELRNRAIGERDVYTLKSQNLWGRQIGPQLDQFAQQAKEGSDRVLRGATSLYIDRLGDPEAFDAALQDALVKWPALKEYVDRMNRMSNPEKSFAEQAINHAGQVRGQRLVDEEIISQARDFHVSHLWEQAGTETTREASVMGGARLSPRTRFARERTFPTFPQGIAAGMVPRTLDVVRINHLRDLDTARAIMAKSIRESLATTEEGQWAMSREHGKIPEDWIDLGSQLRMFRHDIPIKNPDGTMGAAEQHFYVSPQAHEAIKFLYEHDPFRSPGAAVGESFMDKLLKYNSYVKMMELSYSFFHDFNLAKVFAFSRPVTALRGMIPTTDRGPGIYQKWGPVSDGMKMITSLVPTLEKLVRGGLVISDKGTADVWGAYYKMVGGPTKWGLDNTLVRARSRALWETLQPTLKATDAVITAKDALRKFDGMINPKTRSPWTEDEIFAHVGEVMNRKYGGLNWDRYGTTVGQKRMMRALILAPDWTLSNLMLGASALKGGFHLTKPNTMFSNTIEGWVARQSLAKTTASFFATLQAINMLFTGHTTFQNPENRWYSLQLPWKTKDGRNLYADWILPGEMRDLIRIGAGVGGATYGIATNQPMPPQESVRGLLSFAAGKGSPVARAGVSLVSQTRWGGQPLTQPGMTEQEVAKAIGGQLISSIAPVPIGLTAVGQTLWGGQDPTQMASTILGLGATSRGALVPASSWQSLPRANKVEFLNQLSPRDREEFLMQLETGRLTGDAAERFRTYLNRFQLLRRERLQQLPPEERYLRPRQRRHLPPVQVAP